MLRPLRRRSSTSRSRSTPTTRSSCRGSTGARWRTPAASPTATSCSPAAGSREASGGSARWSSPTRCRTCGSATWSARRWWEDTWLNESFADYMGFEVGAGPRPASPAPGSSFETRYKPGGYAADRRRSTHPVAPLPEDVPDVDTATSNFDAISYAKGNAVIRQLVTWLGDEDFLAGVNAHLTRHRFANATLDDLVDALDAVSPRDVRGWAEVWLRPSGHDTIRVERDGDVPVLVRDGDPAAPAPRHGVRRRAGRGRRPLGRPRRRAGAAARVGRPGRGAQLARRDVRPGAARRALLARGRPAGTCWRSTDPLARGLPAGPWPSTSRVERPTSTSSTGTCPPSRTRRLVRRSPTHARAARAVPAGAGRRRGRGARAAGRCLPGRAGRRAGGQRALALTRGLARDLPRRRRAAPLAGRGPHRPGARARPAAPVVGRAPAGRARRARRRRDRGGAPPRRHRPRATSARPPRSPPGPTAEAKAEAWAAHDRGPRSPTAGSRRSPPGCGRPSRPSSRRRTSRATSRPRPRLARRGPAFAAVGRRRVPGAPPRRRRSSRWSATALRGDVPTVLRRAWEDALDDRGVGRRSLVAAPGPGAGRLLVRRPGGRAAPALQPDGLGHAPHPLPRPSRPRPRRRRPSHRRPRRAPYRRPGSAPGRCRCARTATGRPQPTPPELDPRRFTLPDTLAAAARRRLRLDGRAGAGRGAGPLDLGARLPGRGRRPGLRAAGLLGLRRPAAHRRAAAQRDRSPTTSSSVFRTLYEERFPFEELRVTPPLRARRAADRRRQRHRLLRLPADHRLDHDVQPARLRPGHRPRPVPEPLHEGRPGAARARVVLPRPRPASGPG